jgi:urease accessory protein
MKRVFLSAALLLAATAPAFAHLNPAEHGSLMAGFTHPLFGIDHVLAMVAVGLWAALLGKRALWRVPTAFVATMLVGFLLALAGAPLPFVEPTILASVVVIGALVALARPVPVPAGMAVVGFFALFHGFAHGGEIGAAGALDYAAGFALATALLHLAGLAGGVLLSRLGKGGAGMTIARIAGAATALGGLWLAFAS